MPAPLWHHELSGKGEQMGRTQPAKETLIEQVIRFCRVVSACEREALCCGPVTVQQCVALQTLLTGPATVSQLATAVGGSVSATTRLVDGLVKRDFVTKQRDPEDGRKVVVVLPPAGKAQGESLRMMTELAVDQVLQHIPADKIEMVTESLDLLRAAAEACFGPGNESQTGVNDRPGSV